MFRFKAAILLVCIFASVALSFPQDISVASNVTPDEIRAWLRSGNPCVVAWGAYFASRSADDGAVTIMIQLLERGTLSRSSTEAQFSQTDHSIACDDFGHASDLAMSELIYALIERGESISPEAVNAIEPISPIDAGTLAAALPICSRGKPYIAESKCFAAC